MKKNLDITNPRFKEQIWLVPSDFVKWRLHCNRQCENLFHFNRKIMIVKKRFYILNATVKLKSEFSVLHVRDMATDVKIFSLFCEVNCHGISLSLASENTLEQLDTTGLKPCDVRVTVCYLISYIFYNLLRLTSD